jgi:hypothetical protein
VSYQIAWITNHWRGHGVRNLRRIWFSQAIVIQAIWYHTSAATR